MSSPKDLLIKKLIKNGYLKSAPIIEAFKEVDRRDFVLPEYEDLAYLDEALPIGYGQTISQPLTVAFMLELLAPEPGEKILDVGSGSGWTTALLAQIVGARGSVFGIEIIRALVDFGRKNLAKYELPQVSIFQAHAELGLPRKAPFDRILVSASSPSLPEELVKQLRVGGRMVAVVLNSVVKVDKISGKYI